jgi:hypothetical protein
VRAPAQWNILRHYLLQLAVTFSFAAQWLNVCCGNLFLVINETPFSAFQIVIHHAGKKYAQPGLRVVPLYRLNSQSCEM